MRARWRPRRSSPTTPPSCTWRTRPSRASAGPRRRRTRCSAGPTSTRSCGTSTRSPRQAGTGARNGPPPPGRKRSPRWSPTTWSRAPARSGRRSEASERPGASERGSEMNIPDTMRAALLRDFGALVVAEVPTPVPGPGEALVRVRACGICGTDLKIVAGAYRGTWPPSLPFIIGHEWSGEVAALGPDTGRSGLAVGDRVVAENHTGCGACPMCRAGRYNLCERVREPGFKLYGHTAPGALAEYAVRPAVALHKVPAGV